MTDDYVEPVEVYCYNCDAFMGVTADAITSPQFCQGCSKNTSVPDNVGWCPTCKVRQKCFEVGMESMMFDIKECPNPEV